MYQTQSLQLDQTFEDLREEKKELQRISRKLKNGFSQDRLEDVFF